MTTVRDPAPALGTEPGWGRVLHTAAVKAALSTVVSLVVCSLVPALWGWTPQVVMSGSMAPRVVPGDVILTRQVPTASLGRGQIVTVADPDHPGRTRTHRIVRMDASGRLVLRGDANQQADSSHVAPSAVKGLAVLRVPFVGRPVVWFAERRWLALLAVMLGAAWCLLSVVPGAPTSGSSTRRSRRRMKVAVVTAGVLGAVGTGSGSADAAFQNTAANPSSTMNAAATFYPYQTAVLADSPYLYWRHSETSGTSAVDTSPAAHPGTYYGVPSFGQTGPIVAETRDKAITTSTTLVTANASAIGPVSFSVEAWLKTTSTSGGRLIGFGDAATNVLSTITDRQLYLAPSGKIMFGIGTAKTTIASAGLLNDGTWHHVVGTYAIGAGGMKLYVDGKLSSSGTAIADLPTGYWRAGGEQLTGWTGNPTSNYLVGSFDEVAVYTTALSSTRVLAHYDAGVTP